jgi:hydrogenase expression/formation protein HypC
MCLAIPAKIVELDGTSATVDLHGNRVHISTLLTPEARLGDWVLVHAGFAIQHLDEAAAAETFSILADVGLVGSAAGPAGGGGNGGGGAKKVSAASAAVAGGGGGRHA